MALVIPLTKALGQLTWVWFAKSKRQLADFAIFDQAAGQSLMGSAKLVWRLKGKPARNCLENAKYGISALGKG